MAKYNYDPAPGAQNPGKYPIRVGPNYQRYGEQPGYVYHPWSDQYYVDPKAQESYYESIGQGKPKEPGMFEQLAPIGAGALAMGAGQAFASDPSGFIGGIGDLFGGAGAETVAGEVAATQAAAPVATSTATTGTGTGLLGGGAAPATTAAEGANTGILNNLWGSAAPDVATTAATSTGAPTGFSLGGMATNAASMGVGPMMGIGLGGALLARGAQDMLAGEPASYGDYKKDPMGAGGRAQLAWSTGGLSEVGNLLGLNFGSGKSKDQRKRESYRDALQERGFLDEDWNLKGTDGRMFSFEEDLNPGITTGQNYNLELDDQGNIKGDDVRMLAGSIDPLSYIFSQGDEKLASDMTGELTNSIRATGADPKKVQELYGLMGLNRQTAVDELNKLKADKKIDEGRYNAYVAAIDRTLPK